jgi:hypothetical protein
MRNRGAILLILFLAISLAAVAVTPQFWENFTQDDLLKGTLTRISLGPEGKLFLAPAYDVVFDTGQAYIFSAARDAAGNTYLGTAHEGKIYKIDAQGKGTLYYQAKELDVFALAVDSAGILYAGTSPDGKVYKITGSNQGAEFCDPGEKYIWALAFDESGNLLIGTGGKGLVLKVTRAGEKSTFYKPDDTNVMCFARSNAGNLLAGTSPAGMVIEINAQGKGFTLLDTPLEEVRSLAVDRFGTIYAAATSSKSGKSAATTSTGSVQASATAAIQLLASLAERSKESAASSVTAPGGGKDAEGSKSSIYAISKSGSAETIYSSDDRVIYDLFARSDGSLLAASGGKGRLLSIDTAKQVTVVTDSPEEQMTKILPDGESFLIAGCNQGKLYRLQSKPAQNGAYESRVMDAKVVSSWGKLAWRFTSSAGGTAKISTRTGNTEKPDGSWSVWSEAFVKSGPQIPSPKARYLQWRLALERGAGAGVDALERIQIPYLQENVRPQIVSISMLASGLALQKTPLLSSGSISVSSAVSSDGQSLNAPRMRGRESNPLPPRQTLQPGAQAFSWKASDDNEDGLEYSVYFKGEDESDWKLLAKEISDAFYTLDGTALPDGVYRVKIIASDAPSNPFGKALIGELVSRPFVVSNSTPLVAVKSSTVSGKRAEILFDVRVSAGRIASGEFSIDGGDWFLLAPTDGIADSDAEDFRFTTPDLAPGEHLIGLRASDANGSTGTTKVVIRIP